VITPSRHTGGSRYLDAFEIPGFRVALAIASLPGMTIELCGEFLSEETGRLLTKDSECFEYLSMIGKPAMISILPLVLSPVEGLRGFFSNLLLRLDTNFGTGLVDTYRGGA